MLFIFLLYRCKGNILFWKIQIFFRILIGSSPRWFI
nr:MAG TPA_asm: hypothetical protein [Caudoviricetes sp.]